MGSEEQSDESRMFQGPGTLKVYVPPDPAPKLEDEYRDYPPGEPPEVHFQGVTGNYWAVLQESKMPFRGGVKVFTEEQMQWLRSIEPDVDKTLLD